MHEIIFGEKRTWLDWNLILNSFDISEPEVKSNYVEIPFSDNEIDLTEAITGDVKYGFREGEFIFTLTADKSEWPERRRQINEYLHGQRVVITVPNDQEYYYIGRCNIESFVPKVNHAILTIVGKIEAYRLKNEKTTLNVTINNSSVAMVNVQNQRMYTVPTFTLSKETTIKFGTTTRKISAGIHTFADFLLVTGVNLFTFSADPGATIKIEYQEGAL